MHRWLDDGYLGLKRDDAVTREKTTRRENYTKDDNYPQCLRYTPSSRIAHSSCSPLLSFADFPENRNDLLLRAPLLDVRPLP